MAVNRCLKSPWIETLILVAILVISYAAIAIIAFGAEPPPEGMSAVNIFALILGFTLISFSMAFLAAVSGVGGGVLFTPVMLAFTSVDSLIIRATGLIFAMFTGLTSTGPVMKKGLGNLRLSVILAAIYGAGSFAGAHGAIYIWKYTGEGGEAAVRISLGLIVAGIASYIFFGKKNMDWPDVKNVDGFTRMLNLPQPYYEHSLKRIVNYRVKKAAPGILIIAFVGMISGFFGLGAAWAVVLVQNGIMGVPLKVSAANSLAVVGMGNCIAVWPFLLGGAVIPMFVAPWLVGVIMGGRAGSILLVNIKADFIRFFIIGILFFAGFSLIFRGLAILGIIKLHGAVNAAVFVLIFLLVFRAALLERKVLSDGDAGDE